MKNLDKMPQVGGESEDKKPFLENRESVITRIRAEIEVMARAVEDAEVPADVPEFRERKRNFFRAQTPVYTALKAVLSETEPEYIELTDRLTDIKNLARAKYPEKIIDEYEKKLKQ